MTRIRPKLPLPRQRPEQALQIQMVAHLRAVLPASWLVWHTRNQGEARTKRMHGVFRAMGVVRGFPDLCILGPGPRLYAVEVKAPPKRLKSGQASRAQPRLSGAQHAVMAKLTACDVPVIVAASVDELLAALRAHDVPMRGRVMA